MEPLAIKMRPNNFEEIIGQDHLVGKNGLLSRMVDSNKVMSMILYGKPGVGKTTIAYALCNALGFPYSVFNASIDNKATLTKMISEKKPNQIIIIDEFHRMKKDIQDYLLPTIEEGIVTIIGITTINPYNSVNPAIRSRCLTFKLNDLKEEDLKELLVNALNKIAPSLTINEDALNYLVNISNGEARTLLNNLELITSSLDLSSTLTLEIVKTFLFSPSLNIDKNEDNYYDTLSGLQKSIRGSDVHASLHYLAKLLYAEDLLPLIRRLYAINYEDIGLANPSLGPKVKAACDIALELGMPEAKLPLSVITIEMALSPKSNSAYLAIAKALEDLENGISGSLPIHLKTKYPSSNNKDFYQYPHDFPGAWVDQQYLPDNLKSRKYYAPKSNSKYEEALKERYEIIEKIKKHQ